VRYLADKHNQFLQQVHEILQQRRHLVEIGSQLESVFRIPAHLLTDAHLIVYDGQEKELTSFLHLQVLQSLQYGRGTEIIFNFERIEQHLIDSVLIGKPLIDLEIRKFNFANETRITGALQNLRQKIPQLELLTEVKAMIMKDLGGVTHVRRCLSILEICMGFLAATGASHVRQLPGELRLDEYVRDTLLMGDCDEICHPNSLIAKHVQLQHVISLWNLLDETLNVDPFKDISPKYKKPLSDDMIASLSQAIPKFQLALLLPIMKEFILNYLNEASANLGEEISLKETLEYCEVNVEGISNVGDYGWFCHFPPLQMKYALETYKFLNNNASKVS